MKTQKQHRYIPMLQQMSLEILGIHWMIFNIKGVYTLIKSVGYMHLLNRINEK